MDLVIGRVAITALLWTATLDASAATPAWGVGGSMAGGREGHAAVVTPSGIVLAGGESELLLSSAERWEPSPITAHELPPMSAYHGNTTGVAIGAGVLVIGGRGAGFEESSIAELWDGSHWTQTTMNVPHMGHTATVLGASDRVVVVGGQSTGSSFTDVTEIFEGGAWTLAAKVEGGPVVFHAASYLPEKDMLLLTGGTRLGDGSADVLAFRVSTGWSKLPGMSVPRTAHAQAVMQDGRVLVMGGNAAGKIHSSAEIFDPATESFSEAAPMNMPRALHSAVTLHDGRVLVVGGFGSLGYSNMLSSAEIYDPSTNRWLRAGSLTEPRASHGTVILADGRVVVTGGQFAMSPSVSGPATASIEIFAQRKAGETCVDDGECSELRCVSGRCPTAPPDAGPSDASSVDATADAGIDGGTNGEETVRGCTCHLERTSRGSSSAALVALLFASGLRRRARR